MKYIFLLSIFLLSNCARPLYTKDRFFKSNKTEKKADKDVEELVYKVLKRAVVTEKDIPSYQLIWDKSKIYVSKQVNSINSHRQLSQHEVPNTIENVKFSLKTQTELQKIANKSREDFFYLSFSLIAIGRNTATVSINNHWMAHKNSKKTFPSGGGSTFNFKKVNDKWLFGEKATSWIP